MPNHQDVPAQIVETPTSNNGFSYVVNAWFPDRREPEHNYLRGIGAPQNGKVGDWGTISYITEPSMGYFLWKFHEGHIWREFRVRSDHLDIAPPMHYRYCRVCRVAESGWEEIIAERISDFVWTTYEDGITDLGISLMEGFLEELPHSH